MRGGGAIPRYAFFVQIDKKELGGNYPQYFQVDSGDDYGWGYCSDDCFTAVPTGNCLNLLLSAKQTYKS